MTTFGYSLHRGRARGAGDRRGFTLVELMVALAVGSVLLATFFAGLYNLQRSWRASQTEVTGVRNQRAGVEMIVRDIRMAGSGYGGQPIVTAGIADPAIFPLQPKPGQSGDPDTLIITAGFDGISTTNTATMGSPSDPLVVASVANFAVGDLVVVTSGPNANMFQITAITNGDQLVHATSSPYNSPTGHTIWPSGGYPPGSTVAKVRRVHYWIDGDQDPARLVRRLDDGTELPISSGAQGLQIRYGMADGTASASPADPSLIRSVSVSYVPTDYTPYMGGTVGAGDTLTVRIQPRVLG